jgi:hypothetical protein
MLCYCVIFVLCFNVMLCMLYLCYIMLCYIIFVICCVMLCYIYRGGTWHKTNFYVVGLGLGGGTW